MRARRAPRVTLRMCCGRSAAYFTSGRRCFIVDAPNFAAGAAKCGTVMDVLRPAPPRPPRIAARLPVFSRVLVTGLAQCWMTNISAGGMGLTARVEGEAAPVRGDDLEVEFGVGDLASPIRAV